MTCATTRPGVPGRDLPHPSRRSAARPEPLRDLLLALQGLAAVPVDEITEDLRLSATPPRRLPQSAVPPERVAETRTCVLEYPRELEADVLRFLPDLRVLAMLEPSRRDLRPPRPEQKISGRIRSVTATRNRYAICGYL